LTAAEIAVLANTEAGGNQAPTAVALGTPTSGDAPLDVDFDGSGSTDSDGMISTYAWDFGDGSAGSNQQNLMHTYTVAGIYTATLTVTDNDGVTDTDTVVITVTDPNSSNIAPTAAATGTPTSGNAPLDVDFDGSGSTDSDGSISTYAWDFGDGSQISNLQNPTHTYTTAGIYMATLTVTDDEGATNTDTVAITVTNPSGSGLIGHWTLDDGSGAIAGDSSGNSNDGVVNGAAWTTAGQISGALDFDGSDDYVDLGSLNASADSLTISAWINADTLTHLTRQDARIVSKATGTGSQDHYFMLSTIKSNGATRLRFRLMTNESTTTLFGSGGVLTSATWIHVAAVYDGAQMRW
jgi:PKD repeat protein